MVQVLAHRVGQILAPPLVYQAHDLGIIPTTVNRQACLPHPRKCNHRCNPRWHQCLVGPDTTYVSRDSRQKRINSVFSTHPTNIICPNITGIQCLRKCPHKHLINTLNITLLLQVHIYPNILECPCHLEISLLPYRDRELLHYLMLCPIHPTPLRFPTPNLV
jgi:hypothetical protein